MPDGIGPGKGWDIFVNGAYRVSHDLQKVAFDIAHNLQARNKGSLIEIQDNATGDRAELLPDGGWGKKSRPQASP